MEELEDYLFLNRSHDVIRFIDNHYKNITYTQIKELIDGIVLNMIIETLITQRLGGYWNDNTKSCYYTIMKYYESEFKKRQDTERSCC